MVFSLKEDLSAIEVVDEDENEEETMRTSTLTGGRTTAPMMNVAMHIDPTYLSQQSSSMPNSLIFQGKKKLAKKIYGLNVVPMYSIFSRSFLIVNLASVKKKLREKLLVLP